MKSSSSSDEEGASRKRQKRERKEKKKEKKEKRDKKEKKEKRDKKDKKERHRHDDGHAQAHRGQQQHPKDEMGSARTHAHTRRPVWTTRHESPERTRRDERGHFREPRAERRPHRDDRTHFSERPHFRERRRSRERYPSPHRSGDAGQGRARSSANRGANDRCAPGHVGGAPPPPPRPARPPPRPLPPPDVGAVPRMSASHGRATSASAWRPNAAALNSRQLTAELGKARALPQLLSGCIYY